MPIDPEDARWLVDRLYADGAADAVEAGLWIDNAIDRELYTVALEPGQRDAMQRVMIDPPERLAELGEYSRSTIATGSFRETRPGSR